MELRILGPLEVDVDGRRVELGGPKQRAVLAALVVARGAVVSLDHLVDQLWGDQPPARATGSLQAYISNLRRALEPDRPPRTPPRLLVSRQPGYALRLDPDAVDAVRFEQATADGRRLLAAGRAAEGRDSLAAGLGLWRGTVLADVAAEQVAAAERTRLDEMRLVALESRLEADLALGDHAAVGAELDRMVAEHPLRERLWALLMMARYRSGRQAEALRAYQVARRTLADELGLAPGRELQDLERQVLVHDPALEWRPGRRPDAGPPAEPQRVAAPAPAPGAASRSRDPDPLVGRAGPLACLDQALADADGGRRRLVLVSGPPGVGKSRLAEELARRATTSGARVAWGRCPDGMAAPAFWPWTQVLRAVVANLDEAELTRAVGRGRDDLALLVPELDDGSGAAAPFADPPAGEADVARFRLYDSVSRFLTAAAQQSPVVVIVDDLHWADPSSLRLLRFLVEEQGAARLLIIGTNRDREVGSDDPLAETFAEVVGGPATERLALGGLDRTDVGRYLALRLGRDVDDALLSAVHRRTDGNPFFMTELVRLLASEGRLGSGPARPSGRVDLLERAESGIPVEVGEVIRRRVRRLPEDVASVLTVAAVAGAEVRIEVLERACALDLDRLLDLLDVALVTGILVERPGPPGRYRFAHALVQEVLAGDLSGVQRARLHARIARAMEHLWRGDLEPHLSELAHQHLAGAPAGTASEAVDYAARAARQAGASLAHEQAAELWGQALSALDLARPGDLINRYELLMGLRDARHRAGDVTAARQALDAAVEVVLRIGDPDKLAATATAMGLGGGNVWSWRSYGVVDRPAITLLERALAAVGERESGLRCELLGALAVELLYAEERDRGLELSRDALAMARRIADPDLLASALTMHYVANLGPHNADYRLALAEEMADLPALGAPAEAGLAGRLLRMSSQLELGELAGVDADLEPAFREADELRQPALLAQLAWFRATRSLLAGRFEEAEDRSAEALSLHQRTELWGAMECFATQLFTLRREQGRLGELEPLIDDLLASSEFDAFREATALLLAEVGRVDEARAVLGHEEPFRRLPQDWSWLFLTCVQAELCIALDDKDAAGWLHDDLAPHAHKAALIGTGVGCWGSVEYFVGRLAALLDRTDEAIERFQAAVAFADRLDAPALGVRARSRLAEALARRGRTDDLAHCGELLHSAKVTADALGMIATPVEVTAHARR